MAFVADASVTASWFIESQASAYTDRLPDRLADEQVFVPGIWPAEFTNIFLVLERRRKIKHEQAHTILQLAARHPIVVDTETIPLARLHRLSGQYGLSGCDAMYLELALRLELPLCAREGALARAVPRAGLSLE